MGQTRMFRDRVVSMEQTLEGGEKHLELLKALCLEAFPEFAYHEHALDHERDNFVVVLESADGRRKSVSWTRMTLFDAERVPAIAADPNGPLRARIVAFLRDRAARPEMIVTFRHLEDGWADTPEPRPSRRRRRRGGGRGPGRPAERPPQGRPPERSPQGRPNAPRGGGPHGPRPAPALSQRPPPGPSGNRPPGGPSAGEPRPAGPRRRLRRRRRGRGGSPGGPPAGAPPTS